MKVSLPQLLLIAILAGTSYAHEVNSQTILDKTITIHLEQTDIRTFIRKLEEASGVDIVYSSRAIAAHRKISVRQEQKKLSSVLESVLGPLEISYKVVNGVILLQRQLPGTGSLNPGNEGRQESLLSPAADKSISGKVTDEKGDPLPGVSVLIKNSTQGTVTDVNGDYNINVPNPSSILVFSYVGYLTAEETVGSRSVIDLDLKPDVALLREIVVVGYGTQKKQNVTGAISSVNFEDDAISSRAVTNVSTMLAGMSSGIRVRQTNGLPGANNNAGITVRGVGSLNASQAPLVIIDGMIADINTVNPNDVASVSILKDAASAAIYGSRASNGVILITTKSGSDSKGKITFNYNNFVGSRKPTIMHDVISNTADHMHLINVVQRNSGLNPPFTEQEIDEWRTKSQTDPIGYPNTDWSKALIKRNIVNSHNFSARGGNDRVNFFTSADYFKDDGLIANTGFRRINFRNNLTYKVNSWLKLGNNLTFMNTKTAPADIGPIFTFWRATTPGIVPKHPDGRYGAAQTPSGETGANNPLMRAEMQRGETRANTIQGKLFAVLTPLKGLSVTGSYFADVRHQEEWSGAIPYDRWDFQREIMALPAGDYRLTLSNSYSRVQREIAEIFADYEINLGKHMVKVLGGFNQENYFQRNFNASKRDLLSYDTPVLNTAPSDPQAGGNATDYGMRSFFGRLNYSFNNKYFFESNLRYDGSSRFAPDKRWGLFPSFSAGWMLSEENFWMPLSNTVNSFKLRGSWGQLGNNGIGNYEWQEFYQSANFTLNENVVQGLAYSSFGNPLIGWETTDVLNIGADIRLFRHLTLDLNYYTKNTHDILANLPIPLVNGGISPPRFNSAHVKNSGFETELRYSREFGKFGISIGGNFAYNKNRIVSYKGDFIEPRGTGQAWTEGHPIGVYWLREVDYIVRNQNQVDGLLSQGYTFMPGTPGPGDLMYKDANGDKVVNDDDRVLKGNPIPLYTYGGNVSLKYGSWDFNVFADGVGGWDKYQQGDLFSTNRTIIGYLWPKSYMNMWTEENPGAALPKMYTNNTKNNQVSDFFLHSAAYLRIRSLQLGYSLPPGVLSTLRIQKLRAFANLENYFTFTKWPGQDPEVADGTADAPAQTYPLSKTISFGLSVSF